METRDWSLVFFTVLTQAAVGAFLVLQVLGHLSRRRRAIRAVHAAGGGPGADRAENDARRDGSAADAGMAARAEDGARREDLETGSDGPDPADERSAGHEAAVPLLLVSAVLSAGLFAALFHLSTPLQAARAVVNFSSSWLSREIVFGGLFAALLGALAWREWRDADAAPASSAPEQRAASPSPGAGATCSGLMERTTLPSPGPRTGRSSTPKAVSTVTPTSRLPVTVPSIRLLSPMNVATNRVAGFR